jgi:hypothetical protein
MLRTAIWAIRATRTSVQPILDPTYATLTKDQVGGGSVAAATNDTAGLSIGARQLELQAWRDLETAMLGLRTEILSAKDQDQNDI